MSSVGLAPSSSSDLLASFSDDADIAQWINDLLDGQSQQRGDVSELVTRLEVACQDTASQLEQSIDDISHTVPRLAYDLHFLRESALSLKSSLSSLKARVSASIADDDTSQALRRLSYLDTVKTRMEASRDVLREAESWSTLESEVTSLLAESNYDRAAERLADASKSMVVFQNTPEYETRRALMISLQNQLEASLSSALVAAINARDVASCKNYYAIFAHIQRESEFRNYYNGSRRAAILQLWTSTALSDVDGESLQTADTPIQFSELLSRFFTDFLTLVNEERSYGPAIFPNPHQSLSVFVQSTIDSLTPSLSQRLSGMSEHHGASALPEIIKAFRIAEEFAVATDKVMEKVGFAVLFSPQSPAPQLDEISKSHSRRLSKRMSMSRRLGPTRTTSSISGNILSSSGGAWEQALFEPFIDFQAEYQSLEKKHLESALAVTFSASRHPTRQINADGARTFRERSVDVFSMTEEALGRCMSFTHGYGAVGLLNALDHVFASFLDASRIELLATEHGESSPSSSAALLQGETFEELDYSAGDWRTIQLTLHLLDTCRVVRERLGVLEARVRTGLVQVASAFKLARSDPHGLYIHDTVRGEAQLLSQSTLNSVELQTLLDRLEPGTAAANSSLFSAPEAGQQQQQQTDFLLDGARRATVAFTKACQGKLQDTLLAPLFQHLSTYAAASSTWSTTATTAVDGSRGGGGKAAAPHELIVPTFSRSPSPAIQRVAEGLLNLPRLFEVYAEDDALAFSVETLPFVDAALLRAVLSPTPPHPPHVHSSSSSVDGHKRRLSHSFNTPPSQSSQPQPLAPAPPPAPPQPPPPPPPPPQRTLLPPEVVVSAWLSSLTLSLLSHFTGTVLPSSVRALSASSAGGDAGAGAGAGVGAAAVAQLAADLGYLSNIVRALNVEWAELERWREAVECGEDVGRQRLREEDEEGEEGGQGGQGEGGGDVFRAVARLRGWI